MSKFALQNTGDGPLHVPGVGTIAPGKSLPATEAQIKAIQNNAVVAAWAETGVLVGIDPEMEAERAAAEAEAAAKAAAEKAKAEKEAAEKEAAEKAAKEKADADAKAKAEAEAAAKAAAEKKPDDKKS